MSRYVPSTVLVFFGHQRVALGISAVDLADGHGGYKILVPECFDEKVVFLNGFHDSCIVHGVVFADGVLLMQVS